MSRDGEADTGNTRTVSDLDSDRSKLVMLYLLENREATVDELKRELGMTLLSLFGVLKTLQKNGLVVKRADSVYLESGE